METNFVIFALYVELCLIMSSCWTVWSQECHNGSFIVGDMNECHSWLACGDFRYLDVGELIGFGAVKHVYQTSWQNNSMAVAFLNNKNYSSDFLFGIKVLKQLGWNKNIVQLIGFCEEVPVFLTEYHPIGSSVNVDIIYGDDSHNLSQRFHLCIDYVKILAFLHDSQIGPLMMCDSSTLIKTLEQYLLTTSGNLVLNDVDSLAKVMEGGTVCGHRELNGDFVAPEQKWPFDGDEYKTERMPPYSEKADVWKIPPVCSFFLGKSEGARTLRYHLHNIHRRCREKEPQKRPTAREVLWTYETLNWSYFQKNDERKEEL